MMQFSHILFGATLAGLIAAPALAGQAGVKFSVVNTGTVTLECGASIAHWFSEELGAVAPAAQLDFSFGYAAETGTVFRLNEQEVEMAVQRVWCGQAGRAWETRAELPLPRAIGATPAPVVLNCAATPERTHCEAP